MNELDDATAVFPRPVLPGSKLSVNPMDRILAAQASYNRTIDSSVAQEKKLTGEQTALYNANANLAEIIGGANAVVEATKGFGLAASQAATATAKSRLSLDIDGTTDAISTNMDAIDAALRRRNEVKARIDEKNKVNWWEDPVTWIMNQFTIGGDIQEYNSADRDIANAEEQIAFRNQALSATAKAQNDAAVTITTASAAQAAAAVALIGQLNANTYRIAGIQAGITGIQAVLSAARDKFTAFMSVDSAEQSRNSQAIALAHLAEQQREFGLNYDLHLKQFALEQERVGLALKKEALAEAADKDIIDTINKGRESGGLAPLNFNDGRAQMILSTMKSGRPLDPLDAKAYEAGRASQASGRNMVGVTPADALEFSAAAPVNLSPQAKTVQTISQGIAAKVLDPRNPYQIDQKNKEIVKATINAQIHKELDRLAADPNPTDKNNPFTMPRIEDIAQYSAAVKTLPLWTTYLQPLAASGFNINDPDAVVQQMTTDIKNKKITLPTALDYSLIASVGMRLNQEQRRFIEQGYAPPMVMNARISIDNNLRQIITDISKPDLLTRIFINKLNVIDFREAVGVEETESRQGNAYNYPGGNPYVGPKGYNPFTPGPKE